MYNDTQTLEHITGIRPLDGALSLDGYAAARMSPRVIGEVAPITGAILADLEVDRQENAAKVRALEEQVAREKREIEEGAKSRLSELAPTREEIKQAIGELDAAEAELRAMLREAACAAEERAEYVRTVQLDRTDEELRAAKAALAVLRAQVAQNRADLDDDLHRHEQTAAQARADAGWAYPNEDPLRQPDLTDEMIASEDGVVLDRADMHYVPPALAWVVTVISGAAAGFSLGLAAKFLHADTLHREVWLAAICSLFGLATSIALKFGMESVWREVSLRLHSGKQWIASAVVALSLTALVVTIYSTVERRGLMSGMLIELMTNSVRGPKADTSQLQIAATFGSLFLTAPYVLLVSTAGFRKGRYVVHSHRAQAQLLRERIRTEDAKRDTETIKSALAEGSLVTVAQRRIERFNAASDAEIERLKNEVSTLENIKSSLMNEIAATPTPRQTQLADEKERLAAERQRLLARAEGLETRARQLPGRSEDTAPSESKLKEAQAEASYIAARIAHEQERARIEFELSNGNLLQRLRVAVGRRKPAVGTLRRQFQTR